MRGESNRLYFDFFPRAGRRRAESESERSCTWRGTETHLNPLRFPPATDHHGAALFPRNGRLPLDRIARDKTGPPGKVASKRILDENVGLATGQPEISVEADLFF